MILIVCVKVEAGFLVLYVARQGLDDDVFCKLLDLCYNKLVDNPSLTVAEREREDV